MSEREVIGKVPAVLPAHEIQVGTEPLDRPTRDSVGGWAFLDDAQEWPECFCGERMALFFQLDIPLDLDLFGGDHLLVFHCRAHDDASDPELADGRLVPRYWEAPQPPYPRPFWCVLLQRHAGLPVAEPEPSLCALPLTLRPFVDTPGGSRGLGAQRFKVGGTPSWAQDPEHYTCACGADLVYLCQVPEGMEFAVNPGLAEQPYSVGADTYGLFLGNEIYLLACPAHCHPAAVWPVNQN